MVLAGSPSEVAALEDFQAQLARILAGDTTDLDANNNDGADGVDDAPAPPAVAPAPPAHHPPGNNGNGHSPAPAPRLAPAGRAKPKSKSSPLPYRPTILDLPPEERPRERLRKYGPHHLNNAELMAVLINTGRQGENAVDLGMRIIAEFDGLGGLARAGYAELHRQRGISDAKTCAIMAALELGRRIASLAPEERAAISCPQDAANLVTAEMSLLTQENLVVLLLNTRNQVIARRTIYIGTVNSSAVRPAEVLRPAVRENAPSIIVVHNHPSGDPTPSPEDAAVTRDLVSAGKLMAIEVLDHLVIGNGGRFVSMKEKNLGFSGK